MINILVSIDFTKSAQKVALCTAEVAQSAKARLILFHVYRADEATESKEQEIVTNCERYVQARLDKLARKLHKRTGVSITRLMKPVSVANEALEVAKLIKANITVNCDPTLLNDDNIIRSHYDGLPVINVPTSYPVDVLSLKQHLLLELHKLGCSSAPLLEAI